MEEMADVAARQRVASLPPAGIIPIFHQPEDSGDDTTVSTVKSEKSRRRGSLLVSRFGQVRRGWPLFDVVVFNGLGPFQIPEDSVDIAPGQASALSRTASAVSSPVLKSPLYAQLPVSLRTSGRRP